VLTQSDGSPLTQKIIQDHVERAARLRREARCASSASHVLLASCDAGRCWSGDKEVAGHQDLSTTQRSMHVSPAVVEDAIRLLDRSYEPLLRGNMVAAGSTELGKFPQ
jgi:hypothetical protein